MEDLWTVWNSTIEGQEFADMVEYKKFLDRFCKDDETPNQRRLPYGDEDKKAELEGTSHVYRTLVS